VKRGERRRSLRFSMRKVGKYGRLMEVSHFYSPGGGKVFHAYCGRGVVSSFLKRMGKDVKKSRSGKTIYLEGNGAENAFMKLIILAGVRQCIRTNAKAHGIAEIVAGLGEFETIFWYSKMIEGYEKRGYWGVCRIARAFRAVYGID